MGLGEVGPLALHHLKPNNEKRKTKNTEQQTRNRDMLKINQNQDVTDFYHQSKPIGRPQKPLFGSVFLKNEKTDYNVPKGKKQNCEPISLNVQT